MCGETADITKAGAQKPELFLESKPYELIATEGCGSGEDLVEVVMIEGGLINGFSVHKRKRRPLFMRDERKTALEIIIQE